MKVKPNYSKAKVTPLKTKGTANSELLSYFPSKAELEKLYPKTSGPVPPYGGGAA